MKRLQRKKLNELRLFLRDLGLELKGKDKPKSAHYAELLATISKRSDKERLQVVLLRSLSQAVYSTKVAEHFGLAFVAYTHFTSPIRRYSDLLVHRAIYHYLNQEKEEAVFYEKAAMDTMTQHLSMTERRADEATREATARLKCEFMLQFLGEQLEGTISAVTGFGFFVQLTDFYVEGLVHVSTFPQDSYHFSQQKYQWVGSRSGRVYRLGDCVTVSVDSIKVDELKIDFSLLE